MLIYEMRHLPTNKVYIGALKNDSRFLKYLTSSKTVKPMMQANPKEWERHILLKDFNQTITWEEVVSLEQAIIETTAKSIGWDKMFNKGVWGAPIRPRKYKKGNIPHNKGIKMTNTANMGGYRNGSIAANKDPAKKAKIAATKAAWTTEQQAENNRRVSEGKRLAWAKKKQQKVT